MTKQISLEKIGLKINYMKQYKVMENKKWTREEAEQNKNKLLQELQQEPFNTSGENLEWVKKELDQLIDEEEERQKK
jgi:hypothetical protein